MLQNSQKYPLSFISLASHYSFVKILFQINIRDAIEEYLSELNSFKSRNVTVGKKQNRKAAKAIMSTKKTLKDLESKDE